MQSHPEKNDAHPRRDAESANAHRPPLRSIVSTDRYALAALAMVTAIAALQLFWSGTILGQDAATQFYPWYDYLGERLSSGDIPAWNPYQFGGAPFAADPQSGWMYLPAMIVFSLLPLVAAVPVFVVFHLVLAGAGTYTLSRLLGMGAGGALVAGVAYQLAPPIYGRSVCCPAQYEVGSWMPIALVGAELAMRTTRPSGRIAGWVVAGVAVSQALGAWLGQGGYYFLLFVVAFIGYRGLLAPTSRTQDWSRRIRLTALNGGAVMIIGFGLAAAGILPRLEYISRSNVADGDYGTANQWATNIGGVTPSMIFDRLLDPTLYYPGVIVLTLAAIAILLARGRHASTFFLTWGVCAVVMAMPVDTPLHVLLYTVLPKFEQLHRHWPDRVAIVSYLSFAMVAGAGTESLISGGIHISRKLWALAPPLAALVFLALIGPETRQITVTLLVLLTGSLTVLLVWKAELTRTMLPAALAVLLAIDLLGAFNGALAQAPYGGFHRVDFEQHFEADGAAAFLQDRMKKEPGRYIGFDPSQRVVVDGQLVLYRYQFASPAIGDLLVNNRGVLHGIEDAQGYNPVQPRLFVDYLTAMNGHPQEYHDANVYGTGLDSPLFDLLAIRYIVIPATYADIRADLRSLEDAFPPIYADDDVKVLENPAAVPLAWVVHQAQAVAPDDMLPLLASGEIDPRETVLLEELPPSSDATSGDPSTGSVEVIAREPERIEIEAQSDTPGFVVLSETWDPNWRTYVNGKQVDLHRANYLFRAVPIPQGEHIIELRYEPPMLRSGMAVTALTALCSLFALAWAVWRNRAPLKRYSPS